MQYGFDYLTHSFMWSNQQELVNRNSVTVQYKWFGKPITPEAGLELYCHLNHPGGAIVNKLRTKAGVTYRVNKKTDVQVYYYFDNEFNVAYPTDSHILGLSCSFSL
jgi:hypothetical protein